MRAAYIFVALVVALWAPADVYSQWPGSAVRVCGGGDMMLGSNLDTTWAIHAGERLGRTIEAIPDPYSLAKPLVDLLADADIAVLNVEGAIGKGSAPPKCRSGSRNCYAFRQPPVAAAAIRDVLPRGFVVGNLANNHAMDAGTEGFDITASHLRDAGVFVTGTDTLPTIVSLPGKGSVAVLGFSTAQAGPDPRDVEAVARHVRRAAELVTWVVVTMHMGAEGTSAQRTRDSTEMYLGENRGNVVQFAHTVVDAGAHLVLGHGPHVLRAMEWKGSSFIVYSLGNLLTYGPFSMAEPLNRGGTLCATLSDGGVVDVRFRPTYQHTAGILAPDPTARAVWLVDSLSQLDFPATGVRFNVEGVVGRPSGGR